MQAAFTSAGTPMQLSQLASRRSTRPAGEQQMSQHQYAAMI
jgi:hypothetical protein